MLINVRKCSAICGNVRREPLRRLRNEPNASNFASAEELQHRPGGTGVPVAVDDEVIVAVDGAVEIEVAVVEVKDAAVLVEVRIDLEVVVAVECSVEVRVAAVGVLDQHRGAIDGLRA